MAQPILLLIGPLPEPWGGISVHIERLGRLLEGSYRVAYVDESTSWKPGVFNLRSLNLARYLVQIGGADVIHIHSGLPALRFLHVVCSRALGKKTVFTIHGCTFVSEFGAIFDRVSSRLAHRVIVVNEATGARLRLNGKAVIRSAFIPPRLEHEPELPTDVLNWIARQRGLGRKILAANAWRLDRFRGADLYGLDLCIELALELREKGEEAAFVFSVSSLAPKRSRFESFSERILDNGLGDSFLLRHGPLSFVRLIREVDCVLRPTRADGDSLTVREALYLNKPVIASDATDRPEGVTLFRSGDAGDLLAKVISRMGDGCASPMAVEEEDDSLGYYRQLYQSLNS